MSGQLFTRYFLTDGIRSTKNWDAAFADLDAFNRFRASACRLLETLCRYEDSNEATTDRDLIGPRLELLGWADYLPQQRTTHGQGIPDLLLFADADAKLRAASRRNADDRFLEATVVGECKRLGRPLDAPGPLEVPAVGPHDYPAPDLRIA